MRAALATVFALVLALGGGSTAHASLTQSALDGVGLALRSGEQAPLDGAFVDDAGRPQTLGQAMAGRPTETAARSAMGG